MEYLNMYHEKLIENIIVKISECKEKVQVTKGNEFEKLKQVSLYTTKMLKVSKVVD